MKDSIVTGLDVGSTMIRIVVGQTLPDAEERKFQILGAMECPSEGIARDSVNSIDDAVNALSSCLEKMERIVGVPIESAWVGISGTHIQIKPSRGVVAVGKVNGEVTQQDVERAIEAAKSVATPPNYEVLHVIPRGSTIDGQTGIKDPIGMSGLRLEVDTRIIQGLSTQIKNFTKCIYRTGLEIDDIVFAPLANAEAVLTSRQKELGVALVNIGGSTTSIIIFEEGEIYHAAVLPIGSDHITSDLAIGARVALDTAEKIKLEHGTLVVKDISKKDEINLADLDSAERGTVSLKYVAEIIEARVEEIFEKVELELKKVGRSGLLPAGIIVTGGGSKLPGLVELAKKRLKLPARYAKVKENIVGSERINDESFTTALGLAYWGWHEQQRFERTGGIFKGMKGSVDLQDRVKKWFKSLLP